MRTRSTLLAIMVLVAAALPAAALEAELSPQEIKGLKAAAIEGRFVIKDDGTVIDFISQDDYRLSVSDNRSFPNRMWLRGTAAEKMRWPKAMGYCEGLSFAGYDDWRLPSRVELKTLLIDDKKARPRINTEVFPDTKAARYWTGVQKGANLLGGSDEMGGYYVDFKRGAEDWNLQSKRYYVRCVREIK